MVELDLGGVGRGGEGIAALGLCDGVEGGQVDAGGQAEGVEHFGLGGEFAQAVVADEVVDQCAEGVDDGVVGRGGHRDDVGQSGGCVDSTDNDELAPPGQHRWGDSERIAAVRESGRRGVARDQGAGEVGVEEDRGAGERPADGLSGCVLVLDGADVDVSLDDSGEAALVGRRAELGDRVVARSGGVEVAVRVVGQAVGCAQSACVEDE